MGHSCLNPINQFLLLVAIVDQKPLVCRFRIMRSFEILLGHQRLTQLKSLGRHFDYVIEQLC